MTIDQQKIISSYKVLAADFHSNGMTLIPVDKNGNGIINNSLLTKEEVVSCFSFDTINIGLITGMTSQGVQCIHLYCKNELNDSLLSSFKDCINRHLPLLYDKFIIERTPTYGYNLFFKSSHTGSTRSLAVRNTNEVERAAQPMVTELDIIAISSNQGFTIINPSYGYECIQGDFNTIVDLSPIDYELLLACCISFDRMGSAIRFKQYYADINKLNRILYGDRDWSVYQLLPWEDYNQRGDILGLLRDKGWVSTSEIIRIDRMVMELCYIQGKVVIKGVYGSIDRKTTIESDGSLFLKDLAMFPFEVFLLINAFGDATIAAKELIARGFGVLKGEAITPQVPINIAKPFYREANRKGGDSEHGYTSIKTFWRVIVKSKNEVKIEIDDKNYLQWLNSWGLHLYPKSVDKQTPFVMIQNNIMEEVNMKYIKDVTMTYIRSLPQEFDGINKDDLENVMLKNSFRIFDNRYMDFLPILNNQQLKDTIDASYIPFQNGVLKITKNELLVLSYSEVSFAVWKSHILPHNFHPNTLSGVNAVYADFVSRIAGNDRQQFDAAVSVIGYLLHTYKDKSRPYAVNFTDMRGSETPEGGTGKGLLVQGIEHVRKVITLDGKKKDVISKGFPLQRVRPDTTIVAIQDINKDFPFEDIFNWVTEGLTVEAKYGLEKYVSYNDSPKFIINTNYSMKGDSSSHRRRKVTIELYPYFSYAYTPMHQYGKQLFQGWDYEEWNRFYNFMGLCINFYLKKNIVYAPGFTNKNKQLAKETCVEFIVWWLSNIMNPDEQFIYKQTRHDIDVLLLDYNTSSNTLTIKNIFIKWLKKGADFSGLEIVFKKEGASEFIYLSQKQILRDKEKNVIVNIRNTPTVKIDLSLKKKAIVKEEIKETQVKISLPPKHKFDDTL